MAFFLLFGIFLANKLMEICCLGDGGRVVMGVEGREDKDRW